MQNPKPANQPDSFLRSLIEKHSGVANGNFEMEISKYLLLADSTAEINPVTWWRANQRIFPTLSQLARNILGIPATSAPSERAFSAAGLLISAKRSSIDPWHAQQVLFIHDNYNLVKNEFQN